MGGRRSIKQLIATAFLVMPALPMYSFATRTTMAPVSSIPRWIEMMNDRSVNYYEACAEFEQFWQGKQRPKDETELWAEQRGGTEESEGEVLTGDAAKYFFEYKKFTRWQKDVAPYVQADGRILTPGQRLELLKGRLAKRGSLQKAAAAPSYPWKIVGPVKYPTSYMTYGGQPVVSGIGRCCQLKFHPSDPNKMYVVSSSGGLWISTDGGRNYQKTGTDNLPQTSTACVCIDFTNDRILYLGTGDPNYYSDSYGIYKSLDGGQTWSSSNQGIGDRLAVEILMDPANHSTLIAATSDGIWKSTDAGGNWVEKHWGGAFDDMQFKPGSNGQVIYAVNHSQAWRSVDRGESWQQMNVYPAAGRGGRLGLSANNPDVVYVTFVGTGSGGAYSSSKGGIVYRSNDGGENFSLQKDDVAPNLNAYDPFANTVSQGQGNYNWCFAADPDNADIVYSGAHQVCKSTDGGVRWSKFEHGYQVDNHTDMHQLVFHPVNHSRLYNLSDGGVYVSTDGGANWVAECDGISATEFYHMATSKLDPSICSGGLQDNGSVKFYNNTWETYGIADDGCTEFFDNCFSDKVYYAGGQFFFKYGSLEQGARRDLSNDQEGDDLGLPFTTSNDQSKYVFGGTESGKTKGFFAGTDVYRGDISGSSFTWTRITDFNTQVSALALSPVDDNELYVVLNNNAIYYSRNALAQAPAFSYLAAPGATKSAQIAVDGHDPNVVYLACGAQVYRSANRGISWDNVSGSLNGMNVLKLIIDNTREDESVYIATAGGIYYSNATMSDWVDFGEGLPTIARITDMDYYFDRADPTNNKLRVSFYGRGVWECSIDAATASMRAVPAAQPIINIRTAARSPFVSVEVSDPSMNNCALDIVNMQGRSFFHTRLDQWGIHGVKKIDIRDLPSGVYLIRLSGGKQAVCKPFVKM